MTSPIQPQEAVSDLMPRISVIGIGGAGGNAVNNMIRGQLQGVKFIASNTDAQAIALSLAETKLQLGFEATRGLGAGSHPEVGRVSAEESIDEVLSHIDGSNMLFVTAGMGGGTGTGAAPVIAKAARSRGILTIGVVTKPFHFEGSNRMRTAEKGIEELQQYVDTLIVIPNQNLFRVANEKTTFADAFKMADDVLYSGVRSITDLMMKPGLINLDFADVRAVMGDMMGKAMMGTGEAQGEGRAIEAAEAAISSPLLDDVSMRGAKAVLINITGGLDMTLYEVDEAANRIREEVDPDAQIIFGSTFDEALQGRIRVSCVATGIDGQANAASSKYSRFSLADAGSAAAAQQVPDAVMSPAEAVANLQQDVLMTEFEGDISVVKMVDSTAHVFDKPQAQNDFYASSSVPPRNGEEGQRSPSFFDRLLGRKAAPPAPSHQQGQVPVQPQRTGSVMPSEVDLEASDETLDIPAFLRRKSV